MKYQQIDYKNIIILFALILLLSIFTYSQQSKYDQKSEQQYQYYSNKDAYQCFKIYMGQCASQFLDQSCYSVSSDCVKQLSRQSCHFSEQQDLIYNGACFKEWEQKAIHTKLFAKCLIQKCNFKYNSAISFKNLQQCASKVLFEMNVDCNSQCLEKIKSITVKAQKMPLQYAYNVNFVKDNQIAQKIIYEIKYNCIIGDYKQYLSKWKNSQKQPKEQILKQQLSALEKEQQIIVNNRQENKIQNKQL